MADKIEQLDFIWEGLDKNRQKSKGEISAKSEVMARTELKRQGYRVTRIRKKSKPLTQLGLLLLAQPCVCQQNFS